MPGVLAAGSTKTRSKPLAPANKKKTGSLKRSVTECPCPKGCLCSLNVTRRTRSFSDSSAGTPKAVRVRSRDVGPKTKTVNKKIVPKEKVSKPAVVQVKSLVKSVPKVQSLTATDSKVKISKVVGAKIQTAKQTKPKAKLVKSESKLKVAKPVVSKNKPSPGVKTRAAKKTVADKCSKCPSDKRYGRLLNKNQKCSCSDYESSSSSEYDSDTDSSSIEECSPCRWDKRYGNCLNKDSKCSTKAVNKGSKK